MGQLLAHRLPCRCYYSDGYRSCTNGYLCFIYVHLAISVCQFVTLQDRLKMQDLKICSVVKQHWRCWLI